MKEYGTNVQDKYDLAGPTKSNTSNDDFGALDRVRPSALLVVVLLLTILWSHKFVVFANFGQVCD